MEKAEKAGRAGILNVQFEPVLNEPEINLQKVEKLIDDFLAENSSAEEPKKLDLISLPEFFLTGVSKVYTDFPYPPNGGAPLEFLANLARKYNSNIVSGTIIVKEGENLYNRLFVLDRNGKTVAKYDKIHLFKYFGGTEHEKLTPGQYPPVTVDLDFAKIGLSICFDIQYPLLYRRLAQMGAEIIVSPSCWAYLGNIESQKASNGAIFKGLNIARAIENAVYFITTNQSGRAEGSLCNLGHSMMTDPCGEILKEAGENDEVSFAYLDLDFVRSVQKSMPVAFED